jgi:hypothetical protein
MKGFFVIGVLALLGMGAVAQHAGMNHEAMAQPGSPETSQTMMLAAQDPHHGMAMAADKPTGSGMAGCGVGGDSSGGRCSMSSPMNDAKSDRTMKGGAMGDGGMGCPMMAKMKDGKGMSGCCCAGMGGTPEGPKKAGKS